MIKIAMRMRLRNGRASLPFLDAITFARVRARRLPARRLVRLYGQIPAAALAQAHAAVFRGDAGGDR